MIYFKTNLKIFYCEFWERFWIELGPILYLIYANEMLNALQGNTTFAYADNTAIVVSDRNIEYATEIMQKQLNIAAKWCHENCLINNEK